MCPPATSGRASAAARVDLPVPASPVSTTTGCDREAATRASSWGVGWKYQVLLQDLGTSLAVLPENAAGVARNVPGQEEAGRLRVALDALRRMMPILQELVDVLAVEAPCRDLGVRPASGAR